MSVNDPQKPSRTRAVATLDLVAAALAGLLFLVASVRFGGSVAGDELDPSWTMVIRWASLHGLRWGSDIAFTYGPLGYLSPFNASDPASYGAFAAAQIALAAAAAFLFANGWYVLRWPERIVLAAAVLFTTPCADPVWLAMPVFALVGLHAHAAAGRRRALWLLLVVASLYVATLLLIKMSSLLLIVALWFAGSLVLLRARQPRHAVAWLLLVPICALSLWLASGQRFGDLPRFVATVFEISRGYTAAMGQFPPLRFDVYGAAVLGGCGGVGLWAAWRARRDLTRLSCVALCGLAIFIAWRAGFTRADSHVSIFALTVLLALPLLSAMTPAATPWLRAACLAVALAAVPIADWTVNAGKNHRPGDMAVISLGVLANNAFLLVHPLAYRPALEAALDRERVRLDLPLTRAAVGKRTVDLVGTQQGVVIINGFAYRPSPVFQGYGAYTPRLQQLNADMYSGPDRTDFVLLAYSPIDGNLPTSENAQAFMALYRNYHPVLVEKSYLLLERNAASAAPPPTDAGWRHATWGEWNELPTTPETVAVLAVRSELTVAGKALATMLREPGQQIELELADGTVQRFRLGRGAAPGGFLVSPLVQSLDDYVRLFIGAELPAVRRFRLLPQRAALQLLFAGEIRWNVTQQPRRPRAELPPTMRDALFPGFSHLPQASSTAGRILDVDGHRVLFLHSPARLDFTPGAGTYVVSGEIGIVPNAFTTAGCGGGDGVEVTVSGGTSGALPAYRYDPFADAALRPARRFELGPVQVAPGGVLRLDITPGPANNGDCDWSYLRDVDIRAVEGGDRGGAASIRGSGDQLFAGAAISGIVAVECRRAALSPP